MRNLLAGPVYASRSARPRIKIEICPQSRN